MSERLLEHIWGFLQSEFRPLGHTTFHNTTVKDAEWPGKQGSDSFWSCCKEFLVYCHYCSEYLTLFSCYNLSPATKLRDSLVKTCWFVNNEFYLVLAFLISFLLWQKENFISKHFWRKKRLKLKKLYIKTLFNVYGGYFFLFCIFLYFYRKFSVIN